jgi:LysR family transcriptional regulator for metE and metH
LSHQLKEAESMLGTALYLRKSQPVSFSAQGQLLLDLAAQVLPLVAQVEAQLKGKVLSRIRLAVECHACFHWLMPAVKAFGLLQPGCPVEFSAEIEHNALDALLSDELDLVLTTDKREQAGCYFEALFEMELCLGVSADHSLAQQGFITAEQLKSEVLLGYPLPLDRQDLYRYVLAPKGLEARFRTVAQSSQILQLIAAGQGVALLPRWLMEPYRAQGLLAVVPVGQQGLFRTMYAACRQGLQEANPLRQLITQISLHTPL